MPAPRSTSRDLALIATFAGVVAALGLVPAFTPPGFAVPITAQSLGVMLAGAVLGARRGFLSLLLLLVLVAVGPPLLAGGRGGLGVFADPVGRVPARLAGRGVRRGLADRARRADVPAAPGGSSPTSSAASWCSTRWASPASRWSPASRCRPRPSSTWIFIPGDLVKVVRRRPGRARRARGLPGPARRAAAAEPRSHGCLTGRVGAAPTRSRRSSPRTRRATPSRWAPPGTSGRGPLGGADARTPGSPRSAPSRRLTGLTAASRVWVPGPLAATMNLFAAVHATVAGAALVDDPADATHAAPDARRRWPGSSTTRARRRHRRRRRRPAVPRRCTTGPWRAGVRGAPLLRRRGAVVRGLGRARRRPAAVPRRGGRGARRARSGCARRTSAPGTTDRPARCAATRTASPPSVTAGVLVGRPADRARAAPTR